MIVQACWYVYLSFLLYYICYSSPLFNIFCMFIVYLSPGLLSPHLVCLWCSQCVSWNFNRINKVGSFLNTMFLNALRNLKSRYDWCFILTLLLLKRAYEGIAPSLLFLYKFWRFWFGDFGMIITGTWKYTQTHTTE